MTDEPQVPLSEEEIEDIQIGADGYREGLALMEEELQVSLQGIGLTLMVNTFANNTDRLIADLKRARGALREIVKYCVDHSMLEEVDMQSGIYADHGDKVEVIAKKGLGE
jgi:hypothetical protein